MAYLNMAHMPDPKTEYTVNFTELNGGLNLSELDFRLKNTESPAMRNLLWRDGVLCSRDGQGWLVNDESKGVGHCLYPRLFFGRLLAHIGNALYSVNPDSDNPEYELLYEGVPENRGSFFHYFDSVFYKTVGAYIEITYDADTDSFSASEVEGYVPVIVINASPSTGSGSLYQPENRIQAKKTVKYNAEEGASEYQLPVTDIDGIAEIVVDGAALPASGYSVDLAAGKVTFVTAPPVTEPRTNNTVVITYTKENPDAYNSIMDCPYAVTYGGTGDLCVVMGGCPAQPNAFFWNGNNIAMDPTYFPFSQYQFAGDTDDPITGFGKQQSFLVVFKTRSIGRAKQDTTEVDGRVVIDMPYIAINDKIGCDLPWSIQLIDNNLVWCNTEQGVHILKDSSYAYENNIACVSDKVNGSTRKLALLEDVRVSPTCSSLDDTRRYWLCANGHTWVWDYENSGYKDPSWYYFTNIAAADFAIELESIWHLDTKGRLTHFIPALSDYDEPIDKSFRFTAQNFGGYDRLKNVNSVIIVMRPDTNSTATLTYITDYETRKDLTDLKHLAWRVFPRDLSYRSLAGIGFGAVFRRRPMCRRVRHFTMQLDNAVIGQDLSLVAAQVFYNYQGRFR